MAAPKQLTSRRPTLPRRALTSAEFSQLADVPPETEWFANINNSHTRRAYRNDLKEFMAFTGIRTPTELRLDYSSPRHCLAQGLGCPRARARIDPSQDVGVVIVVRVLDR